MSFILDALKKLEQKKQQQNSVPDLLAEHSSRPVGAGKKVIWPYLLLIVLSLNALILLVWFKPWKSATEEVAVDQTKRDTHVLANVDERAERSDGTEPSGKVSPGATAPSSPEKAQTDKLTAVKRQDNISQPVAGAETAHEAMVEKDPARPVLEPVDETESTDETLSSIGLSPSDEELLSLKEEIKKERMAVKPDVAAKSPSIDINDGSQQDEVVDISQLPQSVRNELPSLSLNGHVYSDNSSARIVNINGIILREGEEVSRSLTIDEITLSGVIFTYKDYRFRMRAF